VFVIVFFGMRMMVRMEVRDAECVFIVRKIKLDFVVYWLHLSFLSAMSDDRDRAVKTEF